MIGPILSAGVLVEGALKSCVVLPRDDPPKLERVECSLYLHYRFECVSTPSRFLTLRDCLEWVLTRIPIGKYLLWFRLNDEDVL